MYKVIGKEFIYCTPDSYPIDKDLKRRIDMCGNGANIHDLNKYKDWYDNHLDKHQKFPIVITPEQQIQKNILYNQIYQAERLLRGLIAECEEKRYRQIYPKES